MSFYDLSKPYNQYCEDVLSGKIIANRYIILACERYKSWFNRTDMYFDDKDVDKKIRFMQKIKHVKGALSGQNFILYPYQAWITANLIGWKWTEDNTRVINTALLILARKSGKTFYSSALMLAIILTDGEQGGEGYMIANSSAQAAIAFEHASNHCKSLDPDNQIFHRYRSEIRIPLLSSKIKILSADTSKLDGMSPQVFISDEYGMTKTSENYDILRTGQGARTNPLGIIISSMGFLVGDEYPLYAAWQNATEVLEGGKSQDSLFAAIYQLDEGDDWKDENVWIKSNPTLGGSISYKFLREQVEQAVNSPIQEVSIKTKNFNIWCNSATTWIPNSDILSHTQPVDLQSFNKDNPDEYYCYCGVDLSVVSDLTAVAYMVEKDEICYFKVDYYLPLGAIDKSSNKDIYRKWIRDGYLKTTNSKTINYDEIISDIIKVNDSLPIIQVLYDKWNARTFKQTMEENGLLMTPFSQTLGAFNTPTKEFERMLYQNKIVIDNNPITRWCFSNVELKYDDKENCKPIKSNGANGKIDGVIALLECLGGYLNNAKFTANIELV